jgi:hypothetical protein
MHSSEFAKFSSTPMRDRDVAPAHRHARELELRLRPAVFPLSKEDRPSAIVPWDGRI